MNALSETERESIERACTKLVTAFAYLVDRRRYEELLRLFTEDGTFERPGARAEGQDQLRAFMEARPTTMVTRHICSVPFFERVDQQEATAITYVTMCLAQGEDDSLTKIPGIAGIAEFHDIFRRTPNGWRISRHESRPVMIREG